MTVPAAPDGPEGRPGPLPYDDRLALALSDLASTYVGRDNVWTDSDVLDTADRFTVDPPYGELEEGTRPRPDHVRLTDDLDALADDYIEAQDPDGPSPR